MPIDATVPESPGWWLQRLLKKLRADRPRFQMLDDYYRGENGIPVYADDACKDAFKRLMRISRTNWAALSVEAPLERMQPVGFRTGAAGDRNGDAEAWRIWQANGLDAVMPRVFEASLSMSMSYLLVGMVDPEVGAPIITAEDPREVTVETDPRRRSKVLAGLKVYLDDVDDVYRAWLYLPGVVHKFVASSVEPIDMYSPRGSDPTPRTTHPDDVSEWEEDGEPVALADPSGKPVNVVPIIPMPANPTIAGVGVGEFEPHIPLLDRINYLVLQELQIATLQAFRQRAIQGDLPTSDEDGNPIDYDDIFSADPGALWMLPETAKMWESGQVDLSGIRKLNSDNVADFAAVSGTPLFYLTPEATDGSAEGAALAKERLIFKAMRHINEADEPVEMVMSTAFLMAGDAERAQRPAMEVIWAPPERWTLAQKADAAQKAIAGGMTWRKTMELIWGLSPQEIEEMEQDRAAEALAAEGAAFLGQVMNGSGPSGESAPG